MTSKNQPPLVMTMTREVYQIARVHYKVHNKNEVIKTFSRLGCMDWDSVRNRWTWNYFKEAKNIKLEVAWNKVPQDHIPIILGSFYFKNENEGFINFNSFARATKGIVFFDKWLPRSVLEVIDIEVLNKFFTGSVTHTTVHSEYFDKNPSPRRNDEMAVEEFEEIDSSPLSKAEKLQKMIEIGESRSRKPIAEIERLGCHFYEEGIKSLETALQMREIIALKHFNGNKDYSFYDLIHQMPDHGVSPSSNSKTQPA